MHPRSHSHTHSTTGHAHACCWAIKRRDLQWVVDGRVVGDSRSAGTTNHHALDTPQPGAGSRRPATKGHWQGKDTETQARDGARDVALTQDTRCRRRCAGWPWQGWCKQPPARPGKAPEQRKASQKLLATGNGEVPVAQSQQAYKPTSPQAHRPTSPQAHNPQAQSETAVNGS